MGEVATYITNVLSWAPMTISSDSMNIDPSSTSAEKTITAQSLQEVFGCFETNCNEAEAALVQSSDEHLLKIWTMRNGEKILFTMPRISVWQNFVLNHLVHYGAQMCVHLR